MVGMLIRVSLVWGACGSKNTVDSTSEPSPSSEIPTVAENDNKSEVEATEPTAEIKKDPDRSEDVSTESGSETTSPENKPDNDGNKSSYGASSFTGGNISVDNIGISVPTLDKFNSAGLKKNGNWWGGSVDTMQTIADNANAIQDATGYGTANSSGNK